MKKFLITKNLSSSILSEINKVYQKKNKNLLKKFLLTNRRFINFINQSESKIKQNSVKGIIISFSNGKHKIHPDLMTIITESVSKILGSLIIQNNNNDKLIFVYDRDRKFSMHKGSRYHQTREGGSIHTDNVNVKKSQRLRSKKYLAQPPASSGNISMKNLMSQSLKKMFSFSGITF